MAPPIPPEASKEIERVKSLVARRFPVYDVRVTYDVVEFFVKVDMTTLEYNFEQMREEMKENGYIPMIMYDKGEHIVTVARKPPAKYRSSYVNLALLIITFFTMLIAGATAWAGYKGSDGSLLSSEAIVNGVLTFTLPLLAIIAVHEFGHYLAARRRGIAASLPFFIPSIPPFGTFGAVISIRDPLPDKKTLLEVGIAGPLAGLIVAIPLGVIGLILTNSEAVLAPVNIGSGGLLAVQFPILYQAFTYLVPIEGDYLMHPTAFAAWVGFLVTALNLLPMGQLDGGHIARALLGSKSKYLGYATIVILAGISMTLFFGWIILVVLVLFLGVRHPPPLNDLTPLDVKRKGLGVFAFVILVLAFAPVPMQSITADYSFELVPQGDTNLTIEQGGTLALSLMVNNTGNSMNQIVVYELDSPDGWRLKFRLAGALEQEFGDALTVLLNSGETALVDVRMMASPGAELGLRYNVSVGGVSENSTEKREVVYETAVSSSVFTYEIVTAFEPATQDDWSRCTVLVVNNGTEPAFITIAPSEVRPHSVDVFVVGDGSNSTEAVELMVPPEDSAYFSVDVYVNAIAAPGGRVISIEIYSGDTLHKLLELPLTVV
ncbi:MAG: site-2 protease family protein [Candidatus Thermoplasmatota archaeon]|nr:site-2 protease family protein [Candidatus Thermoplasmatota archaeon]